MSSVSVTEWEMTHLAQVKASAWQPTTCSRSLGCMRK